MLQQGDLLSSWPMKLHWLMEKQMDEIQKLNNKKIKLKKRPVLTTKSFKFGPSTEN